MLVNGVRLNATLMIHVGQRAYYVRNECLLLANLRRNRLGVGFWPAFLLEQMQLARKKEEALPEGTRH